MATAVELEEMRVRLTGDGSTYMKMMQNAAAQTEEGAAKIKSSTDKITGYATDAMTALAAFGAKGFLTDAFNMYASSETILIKLKAAIDGNGGAVEETTERYRAFAKVQKDLKGVIPDETLALLKTAETFGLTGQAAENAAEKSHALAAASDIEASSAMRMIAAMEKGDVQRAMHLARMVPQLRGVKDETEFQDKLQKLLVVGQKTQVALMNSTEGVMKRYRGTVMTLTKQFGQYVSEAVTPVVKWTTQLLKVFTDLDDRTKRIVVAAGLLVAGIAAIGPVTKIMTMWVMPFLSLAGSGFKLLGTLVMTLLNPMAVLSGIFTALAAVAGVVFSPIGLAIAAAAAGIAVFVKKMGGLQAAFEAVKDFAFKTWETVKVYGVQAWEYVQKKAQEFWVWLRPIAQAGLQVLVAAWGLIKSTALTVWRVIQVAAVTAGDAIKSVWSKLTGNGTVAWDTIRDVAIEGLLRIQFIMQNFGKWSDVMWTGMQYRAVEWGNRVLFVFTDVIPAGMKYFFDNFGNLWHAAHEFMLEQLDTMGANIVIFFKNIDWPNVWTVFKTAAKAAFDWVLNAGEATWDALQNAFSGAGKDAFKDAAGSGVMGAAAGVAKLKQEFKKVPEEAKKAWDRLPPFKMPQRQEGDIETQLRKEYEAKKDALNVTYAEFRKKRLKEMADEKGGPLGEEAPKDAEKAGEDAASKYTAGVKKEMEKLEAVLSGSSGARERMKKYLDMLSGDAPSGKGGSKGKGAGPAGMGLAGAPAGDEIGGDFVPAKKELIGQKMRAQAEAIAARNQANIDRQAAAVVAANKKRDAQADAIAAKNVAADKELDKQAALQVARNKNREKLDPNADVLAGPVAADVAAPVADKKAKGEEAKNMIEVLKKILAETAKVAVNTKDDALPKDIAVADLN